LKCPKLVEEFPPDNEYVFVRRLKRRCHSERSEESLIICLPCATVSSRDVSLRLT
jgi:hypothetical protein